MITELIDKRDNMEIVADEIAAILKTESTSQVALATTAGKPDPSLWELRVFQDRSNPWEEFPQDTAGVTPIINVWFESSTFPGSSGDTVTSQKSEGTFNIDVYGYGVSEDNPAGGHIPGDAAAVEATKRGVRLVRNILMASNYTYLNLRGTVWSRWVGSIEFFQPQQDSENATHISGARLAFRVEYSEYSPQYVGQELDLVSAQVKRADNNEIIIEADYDFAP